MNQEEGGVLVDYPASGVGRVTIDRQATLNALDARTMRALGSTLNELDSAVDIRAVVLTGAGERAFSSGFDIHEMASLDSNQNMLLNVEREEWLWRIVSRSTPLVAALNGIVYGAGTWLAVAADIRVGSRATKMKFTAGKYGGANLTWALPPLVGVGRAKDLLLTARAVSADEAAAIGLLDRLVEPEAVASEAVNVAVEIAANPAEAMREIKQLIHDNIGRRYAERYAAEFTVMQTTLRPRSVGQVFSGFLTSRRGGSSAPNPDKAGRRR